MLHRLPFILFRRLFVCLALAVALVFLRPAAAAPEPGVARAPAAIALLRVSVLAPTSKQLQLRLVLAKNLVREVPIGRVVELKVPANSYAARVRVPARAFANAAAVEADLGTLELRGDVPNRLVLNLDETGTVVSVISDHEGATPEPAPSAPPPKAEGVGNKEATQAPSPVPPAPSTDATTAPPVASAPSASATTAPVASASATTPPNAAPTTPAPTDAAPEGTASQAPVAAESSPPASAVPPGSVMPPGSAVPAVEVPPSGTPASPEAVAVPSESSPAESVDPAAAEAGAEGEIAQGIGTVSGTVRSGTDRQPVVGAVVFVLGTNDETVTDSQGHFSIKLASGERSLSIVHEDFPTETVVDVRVQPDKVTDIKVELRSVPGTYVDEVVVTARPITGGVAALLSKRRDASSVTDALGSAEMAKAPDGSASAATRRIVGASIVGGQFLFVRGLGGRYANTRLNGAPLANTDPDLPGFQLDLFPTSLLAGLTVSKTFNPDMPADFAGGSLNVETRMYPDKFTVRLSAGVSADTQTTGRQMWGYHAGKTDFLGFDDGSRALPKAVPEVRVFDSRGRGDLSSEEVDAVSRSFPNNWKRSTSTAMPSPTFGVSVGDRFQLGPSRVGYLLNVGYRRKFERVREQTQDVSKGPDGLFIERSQTRELGKRDAQLGGLGTVTYEYGENHRVTGLALLTQTGTDTAAITSGTDSNQLRDRTQFQWVERQLLFGQLLGDHKQLFKLFDIRWQLNAAGTKRNEPDTRDVSYQYDSGSDTWAYISDSNKHFYSTLKQDDLGGALDLSVPILNVVVAKAGYLGQFSNRNFDARVFTHADKGGSKVDAPELIFDPANATVLWDILETTGKDDRYANKQQLHAAYALAEVSAIPRVKLIGGARLESFKQRLVTGSPYLTVPEYRTFPRLDQDILPAFSAVASLTDTMYLRAAYGNTVARGMGRELAPVITYDYLRRRNVTGNPNLLRTLIHNFDLRWELFPTPTEVFAVSAFYKQFLHPIESVIRAEDSWSFANVDGAQNYGIELEARAGLGLVNVALSDFSIVGNLALIQSRVILSDAQKAAATNKRRALAGQSPYILNFGVTYEPQGTGLSTSLYYNVFGPRISDVGTQGLPDVFEQPFHSLDLTANYEIGNFSLGLSATNLLFQPVRFTQGEFTTLRSQKGINLGLSAAWKN